MDEKSVKRLESDIATITFSGGNDSSDDDELSRTQSSEKEDTISVDKENLLYVTRFNPFDRDEDHTRDQELPLMNVNEDHFALPEGAEASVSQLEEAIGKYKHLITQCNNLDRQRELVAKLVQLRLQLVAAKEAPDDQEDTQKHVLGHRFVKKEGVSTKHYCEQCSTMIWGVLGDWFRCAGCGFCCHTKCLNNITRTCACVKVDNNPHFLLAICPEKGLSAQNYRCAECRAQISFQRGYGEPRRCDYTGAFYCSSCHWNDSVVIPARVLHNWDFEPRKVCRASKQFLRLMLNRAVLRVQDINPMLFVYVQELNQVKKLREEILVMKKYFLSCAAALRSKLLLQLASRQHFVENSDMYSLLDLIDVAQDTLLPELVRVHASFAQHIKADCQVCESKGYRCGLCEHEESLFPFDTHAIVCARCSAVLHRHCYFKRNQQCPNCDRLNPDELSQNNDVIDPGVQDNHWKTRETVSKPNPFDSGVTSGNPFHENGNNSNPFHTDSSAGTNPFL